MEDFIPIIVAVITTLGTVWVAYLSVKKRAEDGAPAIPVLPLGALSAEDVAKLRDEVAFHRGQAERWKELHDEAEERAEFAERTADACDRRLNALYRELAERGVVEDRRAEPRTQDGRQDK